MTYKQVLKKWNAMTPKERTGRLAKKMAKECGCRSMGEVKLAVELQDAKRDGKIKSFSYESEKIPYQYKPSVYTPDFKVKLLTDEVVYVEYKGKMKAETMKKHRAIRDCNPDKDVRMVFERGSNKIRKGSKTTYLEWARKNRIPAYDKTAKEIYEGL